MEDLTALLKHIKQYPDERFIEEYRNPGDPRAFFEVGAEIKTVEYGSTGISVFGVKLAREHKLWTPKRKRDEDTDLESPYPRCYAIIHFVPRFLSEKKNIKIDNKFAITNMVPKPDLIEYLQKKGHNNLEFGPPHTRDANQRTSFECSVYIDPVLEDVKRVIIDITEKTIKKKLHLSQK